MSTLAIARIKGIHSSRRRISFNYHEVDRVEKMLQEHMKVLERRVNSLENKVIFLGLIVILRGWAQRRNNLETRMELQNILRLLEAEQKKTLKSRLKVN